MTELSVPTIDGLRVSVLLVVHGRVELALGAVRALIANTPPCFELIVVNNATPPRDWDRFANSVQDATLLSSGVNLGFGGGMNWAASHARGEYLVLLNSDVEVEQRWLEPLLATLDGESLFAAAGPLLLHPDGSIQEAGSVVFAGARTEAVTDGDRFALDFVRSVPYTSAACLLIRRSVFNELGGFDAAYGRGYYEDVELAFELAERNLLVAYVPSSRARHVRGASTTPSLAHRLSRHNHRTFVERWATVLGGLPTASGPMTPAAALRGRDAFAADRLLVIDDRVPHVDRGSGDPRMAAILTELARARPQMRVTLLAASTSDTDLYAPDLLSAGVEIAAPPDHDIAAWMEARTGFYSAVMISRLDNFDRFRSLIDRTQPQAIRIVDVEAVYSARTAMAARLADNPAERDAMVAAAAAQRASEFESWNWASIVTCVSPDEAQVVATAVPASEVMVVAHAHPAPERTGREGRSGAVFFGGFMAGDRSPNVDSVEFLVGEIMPRLWSETPDLRLKGAGADPTPRVLVLHDGTRVDVVGPIDDIDGLLASHLVHLAPVRFGAGIKLKLVESMACGLPFVTTSCGAEGLRLSPELRAVTVADEPHRFARLAVRLVEDPDLWERTSAELFATARRYFSPTALRESLDELMARIGALPPALQAVR